MENFCKRCMSFGESENLKETLVSYINSLDEDIKVNQQEYQKRLEACDCCEYMIQGMCKYCGCFVMVRAWKKDLTCPYPKKNQWIKNS